jgi:NTE family protein
MELGVDPAKQAEMVVGTSAGSYLGSSMTSGHFERLSAEFDFFGHFPGLFAKMAPLSTADRSQKRAQEINFAVKDGDPASIRAIGHAALAADNRVNGQAADRLAWLLTGDSKLTGPRQDVYDRERLLYRRANRSHPQSRSARQSNRNI